MNLDSNGDGKMISVVLPTFNEKDSILLLVKAIHEELKVYPHEIIVVDDNSPDGTYALLSNAQLPYLKPILRTTDRGFAKSIRCGVENAQGDIIVIMDSDFNHQPKYLPLMVENMRFYDCVSGSRYVYGGKMVPRSRYVSSYFFNFFVRKMTGGMVTDSLYGYLAIRKDVINKLDFDKIFWGYGDYCIRLLYYMQKKDISILQFPAENGERLGGEANSNLGRVFRQYFWEVVKLTYKIKIRRDV